MKKGDNRLIVDALIMVLQFGINMIVPILMCTLAGAWIGQKTGITWLAVPMFFIGAFAGFNNVYKMAKKLINEADKNSGHGDIYKDIDKRKKEARKAEKNVKKD